MRSVKLCSIIMGLVVFMTQGALAGPVILSGMDPEDHRFEAEPTATAALEMVEDIMTFIHNMATNGGSGILMLGGSENSTPFDVADEAAGLEGITLTHAFGADIGTEDFSGFAALYMPTVDSELNGAFGSLVGEGLTVADLDLINGRAGDIQDFVNGGGGLGAFSQNEPNGYQWFPLGGLETTDLGFGGATGVCVTTEGMAVLEPSATSVEPFHTTFDGPAGFFGLEVLARDDDAGTPECDGPAIIIGGLTVIITPPVTLDIHPTSCPNPFNKQWIDNLDDDGNGNNNGKTKKGGVMPAALVGSEDFDVTDIDPTTVRLDGIEPLRWAFEDVTRPATEGDPCPCTTEGPDGILDLTLKFSRQEVAELLAGAEDGDVIVLEVTGRTNDGMDFMAEDCVVIRAHRNNTALLGGGAQLAQAAPNPFNPVTTIGYSVSTAMHVTIDIYDVSGRLMDRIVNQVMPAGNHRVVWDAGSRPSGVYFYRMRAGDYVETRQMTLLK